MKIEKNTEIKKNTRLRRRGAGAAKVSELQSNPIDFQQLKERIESVGGYMLMWRECREIKHPHTVWRYLQGMAVYPRTEKDILAALAVCEKLEKEKIKKLLK